MATQLLTFLSAQTLPYSFSNAAELDDLRILVMGGLVKAEFFDPSNYPDDSAALAIVHAITTLGRKSLRYFLVTSDKRQRLIE